jgi:phosphatidylinositol glycan class V
VFPSFLHASPIVRHALSGILTSHISHLGAVTTLYSLVRRIVPAGQERKREIAFIAACLHTVSPAGLFLSAPYGESTFAFTTFLGILCYVCAQEQHDSPAQQSALPKSAWILLSGFSFGLSTLFRSNGLLHGTIFFFDAIACLRYFFRAPNASNLAHLIAIIFAGSFIAIGFALPQAIAYLQYCTPEPSRPWCSQFPPSIYSWVQKHYWNVGFLSYWTPNNIPLFLLAAPMLAVLSITALAVLLEPQNLLAAVHGPSTAGSESERKLFTHVTFQLAVPQIILAAMATTSFHVQIINRISSGCALWYVVLAVLVAGNDGRGLPQQGLLGLLGAGRRREVLVRSTVGYAIVQGGLYAAFLPPA